VQLEERQAKGVRLQSASTIQGARRVTGCKDLTVQSANLVVGLRADHTHAVPFLLCHVALQPVESCCVSGQGRRSPNIRTPCVEVPERESPAVIRSAVGSSTFSSLGDAVRLTKISNRAVPAFPTSIDAILLISDICFAVSMK
jgi:hypothetical protein